MVRKLKAVGPDDVPESVPELPANMTGLHAALGGSERDLLVALRSAVASRIEGGVPTHTLASLVRQLRELDREIRALDAKGQEQPEQAPAGETSDGAFDASAV